MFILETLFQKTSFASFLEEDMTRLLLIMAEAMVLAWFIGRRDARLRQEGRKDRLFTFLLITALSLFCGLRTWYNDTATYKGIYENMTPLWSELSEADSPVFSQGIGFYYLNSAMKTLGFSTQDYLMFYAFVTTILYVKFIRRYSVDMVLTVFLFFTTGVYTFSLAAIKQSMATAICLYAIPLALERKWIPSTLVVGLGCMFHPYALIYALLPFLIFEPWKGKTFICVALFVCSGFLLENLLGTVLSITDMMGAEYTAEEMLGEGVNIFRVLVCFAPMLLSVFYGSSMFQDARKDVYLMFNLAMVNALIMFVGLFGTANYFARLANYFLPSQMIILPWMLRSAHPKDRRWLITLCMIGYLGYFAYENAILRPFDQNYSYIGFWDYLTSLIK